MFFLSVNQKNMYGVTRYIAICNRRNVTFSKNPLLTDSETTDEKENLDLCETIARTWDGVVIFTEKEQIRLLVSNTQSCCERWGFQINDKEKSITDEVKTFLFEHEISQVNWNHTREKKKVSQENEGHYACIDIFIGQKPNATSILVDVYCNHNGYYRHDLLTVWHNHKDEQQL
jgi:hypothetical protein